MNDENMNSKLISIYRKHNGEEAAEKFSRLLEEDYRKRNRRRELDRKIESEPDFRFRWNKYRKSSHSFDRVPRVSPDKILERIRKLYLQGKIYEPDVEYIGQLLSLDEQEKYYELIFECTKEVRKKKGIDLRNLFDDILELGATEAFLNLEQVVLGAKVYDRFSRQLKNLSSTMSLIMTRQYRWGIYSDLKQRMAYMQFCEVQDAFEAYRNGTSETDYPRINDSQTIDVEGC